MGNEIRGLTLQAMRDAVRTQLDLEITDLGDALVDGYIQEGFQQTVNMQPRWPFYETQWTVTSTDDGAAVALPVDLDSIATVNSADFGELGNVSHDEAERHFGDDTGYPELWSTWAGSLHLWPGDNAVTDYTLRGWRLPLDWQLTGAGAYPDCDYRLHRPIVHYAIYLAYAGQEDDEGAPAWRDTWARTADSAKEAIMKPRFQGTWALGEGRRRGGRGGSTRLGA